MAHLNQKPKLSWNAAHQMEKPLQFSIENLVAALQAEIVTVHQPDDHIPSKVLKLKSGYEVTLRWIDSKRLEIGYPDSARVDHWQNWFGRMGDGKVELLRLASKHGMFVDEKSGCKK